MKLREALTALCEIEEDITVDYSDPDLPDFATLKAWPFWPPSGGMLETPCFFHTFRLRSKRDVLNGQRLLGYEIGIQVAIAPSSVDADMQSERAVGVHEAIMDALSAKLMLGDGGTYTHNLRSDNGATLARLVWPPESDNGYVGLDYTLDLYLHETQTVGTG